MATQMFMLIFGMVKDGVSNSRLFQSAVNLGNGAKAQIVEKVSTLLERLGLKTPKTKTQKIRALKKVQKQV